MKLTSQRVVALLWIIAGGIVAVHVTSLVFMWGFGHDTLHGVTNLFDVDGERNVPSFFSFSILMFAAALPIYIALHHRHGSRPRALYWVGLGVVFTFLAFDEGFEIHEHIAKYAAGWVGAHELHVYAWLAPYAIFCLAFVIIYTRFLRQLERSARMNILLAGIVYVAGAAGAEMIGAAYVHVFHTEHALGYDIETAIEESLEMAGAILFICALFKYIETHCVSAAATADAKKKRPGTVVPGRDDSAWSPEKTTSA